MTTVAAGMACRRWALRPGSGRRSAGHRPATTIDGMATRAGRPAIRIEAFHVADFVHPDGSPLAGRHGIVMAYALIHPEGVLLFDTGIGFGDADIERTYRPVVRYLPDLLRARGIDPDSVAAVANSHLHFDHCGQNGAFAGRPIHVQAPEYDAAQGIDYTVPAWVAFAGARYERHAGEVEVYPGVTLVPTPGHTPGHQSLLVDAAEGRTAIVGQAVYTRAEWEGSDDASVSGLESAWDRGSYRSSVERIHAFRPDTVLFGHDR
jgi:N-acyl homoserine lactone hydrolase